ncbi:protease SohB [Buchnera aphidicola]|uniref:Probable protease SohB n=1 Tax=Buchnera aphidicola subsp. Schizaphis graminum (strain Sg) TaxID=198804 RepID=SOHB_BUCAP|nr:protease SohB [Buchnera aphidicola]Q8K9P8.1 RecName: Full=Probable protease SohB [Buchnera aphidicola str. Sg (Schizaphis graminum)]AAM67830.1 possible protease SohB [Buchnera aphidicola str. Sg (Schizaphis graminum)]AWI49673.1 protease SohB [Buchnera aphidicola (Schizaphis graminum)]
MNLLLNYELFLAKAITFLFIIFITPFIFNIIKRKRTDQKKFKIILLEEKYKNIKKDILLSKMNKLEKKKWIKEEKKKDKEFEKKNKNNIVTLKKKTLFVLDFKGGIHAHEVIGLREEISAILLAANKDDEVLLRLESSGGVIHGYGLAAAQLERLRQNKIRLIISIDKIAASGGYMMACVADYIISAPFAIIGSIGVVGQLPNFNKLLKKCNIDVELHTAGDYKRTLTMFGQNTELTRKKFCQELNLTHEIFKKFIKKMRPCLDIENISNGEHWFGTIAFKKNLVDEINTSDNILMSKMKEKYTLLNIQYIYKNKKLENFTSFIIENIKIIIIKIFSYKKIL